MVIVLMVLVFLFGLVFGSFFNVLIYRLNSTDPKTPRFWQGRSLCPKCRKEISWFDNIPLLSFVLLRGKCRNCHQSIGWQYPVVELVTGVITVLVLTPVTLSLPLNDLSFVSIHFGALVVAYCLIVVFFSDLLYGLIPDEMIVVAIGATCLMRLVAGIEGKFSESVMVGAVSALGFFGVVLVSRFRGMGLGDVKLAFLLGFFLGWPTAAVGFWLAFVGGGVVSLGMIALKQTKFSATIALGPFLVLGAGAAALWSNELLHMLGI